MACKKAPFTTRRAAEDRLVEIQRCAEAGGAVSYLPTRAYRCHCGNYHLTSNPLKWRH